MRLRNGVRGRERERARTAPPVYDVIRKSFCLLFVRRYTGVSLGRSPTRILISYSFLPPHLFLYRVSSDTGLARCSPLVPCSHTHAPRFIYLVSSRPVHTLNPRLDGSLPGWGASAHNHWPGTETASLRAARAREIHRTHVFIAAGTRPCRQDDDGQECFFILLLSPLPHPILGGMTDRPDRRRCCTPWCSVGWITKKKYPDHGERKRIENKKPVHTEKSFSPPLTPRRRPFRPTHIADGSRQKPTSAG